MTYDGQETFAFPMSDKYILGLYTHCISARRAVSRDMDIPGAGFSEKEQGIASLEDVRDVLFQSLQSEYDSIGKEQTKTATELAYAEVIS